ncbi:WXG100 family type VII secretion target [Streptomyces sp. WG-D5]
MWWPDADADQLREAASAWRAFAESVDDVTAATHKAARNVIDGNEGQSIEVFADFWARYHKGAKTGWLDDLAESARSVAKSLDMYADAVDEATGHLWTEIGIAAAALGAGVLLAVVTGGAGAVAGSAAAEGVISAATGIGVTVSAEIAGVIGTTMVGVAFGSIESIAVDLAVAQPLHIAAGDQESINVDQAAAAGASGAVAGGVFGEEWVPWQRAAWAVSTRSSRPVSTAWQCSPHGCARLPTSWASDARGSSIGLRTPMLLQFRHAPVMT